MQESRSREGRARSPAVERRNDAYLFVRVD